MSSQGRGQRLRGRASECETLRDLISTVQSGSCQVLVLRGEAGVGKTALLEYVSELASGFRCVAGGGRSVRYGARLRRPAAAVRAADGSRRRTARTAARGAERGFRPRCRTDPGPLPGRAGGAEPDGGRRQRPTLALCRRRRAVARPSVGADAGLRRAAPDGRAGRAGLRGTRAAAPRCWPACRNW